MKCLAQEKMTMIDKLGGNPLGRLLGFCVLNNVDFVQLVSRENRETHAKNCEALPHLLPDGWQENISFMWHRTFNC